MPGGTAVKNEQTRMDGEAATSSGHEPNGSAGGVEGRSGLRDQGGTDFGVLEADVSVRELTGRAPDPLRSAPPALLRRYRRGVASVIAARRAGVDPADR
jgi:hypothetical protein